MASSLLLCLLVALLGGIACLYMPSRVRPHSPAMFTPPHWITQFIAEECLPPFYAEMVRDHYLPLATKIAKWSMHSEKPLVVGINGGQGTGKSTLSRILTLALQQEYGLRSAILSIDDIYLTRSDRKKLAEKVNPLLVTRGVPGTHDVKLGIELLTCLKNKTTCKLPVFDKAIDDRAPESDWHLISSPVDIVLFEGWCIGARPQEDTSLACPVNHLEKSEDANMSWRSFVNDALRTEYQELFSHIDRLVMLKAPDFECIQTWRNEQEIKLKHNLSNQKEHAAQDLKLMTPAEIKRFIMHYERITRWMFDEMPGRADCVIELNASHQISQVLWPKNPSQ